jgi:hypothetical protein
MTRSTIAPAVLAGLCLTFLPAGARADRLDRKLNEEMPAVIKYLRDRGYKNVGVLRFQVQKGKKKARFDNAPLNGSLAVRIENLLVVHNGPKEDRAIGIIHDAGAVAGKQKVGNWYSSQAQRQKLFGVSYPLAWGTKKVKADAFLTGLVRTSTDLKTTTVEVRCIDAQSPAREAPVRQFSFKSDSSLVRDLGISFALSRGQRKSSRLAKRSADEEDRNAVEQANQSETSTENKPSSKTGTEEGASPANVAGIEVRMLAGGKDEEVRPAGTQGDGPRWQVECPAPGTAVAFALKNTSDRKLGVVLKLNGVSTIDQQKEASAACRKWVIDPGKTYVIKGFYVLEPAEDKEGKAKTKVLNFAILVGQEAKLAVSELGDKAGLIEVDVFEEAAGPVSNEDEMQVSARGLKPRKARAARSRGYSAYRKSLLDSAGLRSKLVRGREVIVPEKGEGKPGSDLNVVKFESRLVGGLSIKVLPKEDKPAE